MSAFFSEVATKRGDIESFIASSKNGKELKYGAVKNGNHRIYFPFRVVTRIEEGAEVQVPEIFSWSVRTHEWNRSDGSYSSAMCTSDIVTSDGEFDGRCEYCNRVEDAYSIFQMRLDARERELAARGVVGDAKDKELKAHREQLLNERKMKGAREIAYTLGAVFELDANSNPIVDSSTGLPKYTIKLIKMSNDRASKVQKALQTSQREMAGSEINFVYGNEDNPMQLALNVTIQVAMSEMYLTKRFPGLLAKIDADAQAFDVNEITKSYPETKIVGLQTQKETMDVQFAAYDSYLIEKRTNPEAKYTEYFNELYGSPSINALGQVPMSSVFAGQMQGQMQGQGYPQQQIAAPQAGQMPPQQYPQQGQQFPQQAPQFPQQGQQFTPNGQQFTPQAQMPLGALAQGQNSGPVDASAMSGGFPVKSSDVNDINAIFGKKNPEGQNA